MHGAHPNAPDLTDKLRANLGSVRSRIEDAAARSRRDPRDVRLLVVTKAAPIEAVLALVRMGTVDLGESRVQQLVDRARKVNAFLADPAHTRWPDATAPGRPVNEEPTTDNEQRPTHPTPPQWHMVGYLQRNKVKSLLPAVTMVHSVDRLPLAEEINKRAGDLARRVDVLLEVNGGDEPQKSGVPVCAAAYLGELVASLPHVRLRGLMSMAPLTSDENVLRNVFTRVRELFDEMRSDYAVGDAFDVLSMGMSSDFEIAVECGANLVRIGTAVFEGV